MTGAGAEIANFAIDKTHWKKIAELINDDEEMTGELLDFSDKILSLATLLECKLKVSFLSYFIILSKRESRNNFFHLLLQKKQQKYFY